MKKIGNLYLVFYVLIEKDKDKRQLRASPMYYSKSYSKMVQLQNGVMFYSNILLHFLL